MSTNAQKSVESRSARGGRQSLAVRMMTLTLVLGSLGLVGVSAANAAVASCSSGRVCVYDNINYGTQLGWRTGGFALQDVSSGNNDKMSSWSNNSGLNACWYQNSNGGGWAFQMNQYTDNANVGTLWQDRMSSWKGSSC